MKLRFSHPTNWRIVWKIGGGFAVVLGISATIAVAGGAGLWRTSAAFTGYRMIADNVRMLSALQESVAAARLGAGQQFVGDEGSARRVLADIDAARTIIETNARQLGSLPEEETKSELLRMQDAFKRVARGLSDAAKERADLEEASLSADKDATDLLALLAAGADVKQQLMASDIGHLVMESRLAAQRFLESASAEDREQVEQLLARAIDTTTALDKEPNVRPFHGALDQPDQEDALRLTRALQDELLRQSDFVALCLPLGPGMRHLVDRRFLACMKPGALLINTARGSLVDEAAVADALESGALGGYAADTFAMEDWALPDRPCEVSNRLREMPEKTLFTPHLGSAVDLVRRDIALQAATSVLEYLQGEVPSGAVNQLQA
jgi:hypothetical protein